MSSEDAQSYGLPKRYRAKLPPKKHAELGGKGLKCMVEWTALVECYVAHDWNRNACLGDASRYHECLADAKLVERRLASLNFHLRKVVRLGRK